MEQLNIVFDIWIDAEEYEKLYSCIKLKDATSKEIKNFFTDNGSNINSKNDEENDEYFASFLGKPKTIVESYKNGSEDVTGIQLNSDDKKKWDPLFLSKYLRAKILEKGTDDYTQYLVCLVTYLQQNLPYLSPKTTEENILQSLYFQELSACGKPGRESLGFAIQANELLTKKNKNKGNARTGDDSHYSLELYILWAKYNQGIGYSHSGQKDEASEAFDEIIRNLSLENNETDKKLWKELLFYPAILSKAELLETLQFSYHTIKTLEKLDDTKNKSRLIKEALAYRDMGRMEEARKKIEILLDDNTNKLENFFQKAKAIEKRNIKSKALGLLFDYFLLEFEQNSNDKKIDPEEQKSYFENLKNDLMQLGNQFKEQLPQVQTNNNYLMLIQNKSDRASYYRQAAKFLKILSDKHSDETHNKAREDFYLNQIKDLYTPLRDYLLPFCEEVTVQKSCRTYDLQLKEFDKYGYDIYTESMEKFYRNLTSCGFFRYLEDEKILLINLNNYEKQKYLLYKFKELERKQRICQIHRISNGLGPLSSCKKCFSGSNSEAFNDVLKCCSPICCNPEKNKSVTKLVAEDYENIMERENNRFLDYLAYRSRHPVYQIPEDEDTNIRRRSFHFMGLQRWNSQTPTLTMSQGGGYFLYEQDKNGNVVLGIAIDPGFDFVDNLFHMGFTINDIDFILLSHAHLDHIRDFEPIISSLLDLNKRKKENGSKKKIHAIMTWGVHRKLQHVIENNKLREFLADTYILDIDKDSKLEDISYEFRKDRNEFMSIINTIVGAENISSEQKNDNYGYKYFEIKPTRAYHNDHSEKSDSYGYIINFYGNDCGNKGNNNNVENNPVFSFGYTGDTKWDDSIPESYKECDAVCIHLGALIESENGKGNKFEHYRGPECEALIEKKQHPYLFGLLRYLKKIQENSCKNKLLLISEFGEELKGGIRIDFIRRLNELLKSRRESPVCLPVDIGLNVVLASQIEDKENKGKKWAREHKVWCYGCEKFVDSENVGYRHFSHGNNDEALFYFCNTCLKSKPENFFQSKMRLICENGLPLEKAFENNKG